MVRQVGGYGLRDTPAKGRRRADGVDAETQEAGADPFPYNVSIMASVFNMIIQQAYLQAVEP